MISGLVMSVNTWSRRPITAGVSSRHYFPAAAPEEFIEGHRQHLAVEFTNWIVSAAESLGRTSNSPVPLVVTGTEHYRS
ncbi:MAG: hypothetical protein ABSA53_36585 [Streptosporangiaceae bacterium]